MVLLFPSLALGEYWGDLVLRYGLYYKKFTEVPFTGKVEGEQQGKLKDGKEEGPWVHYHENGKLFSKGTFKDGKKEGPWVIYNDNGKIWSKGTWKDGIVVGPWEYFHKDGKKVK